MAVVDLRAPSARPGPGAGVRSTIAGVALLLLGLLAWGAYRFAAGTEDHAYAPGAVAPSTVTLTAGKSYGLALPGGVPREIRAGVDPGALRCTATARGTAYDLALAPEQTDTKATTQIAGFSAPVGGRVRIACSDLPQVFVDDADDAAPDYSGWLLVGAMILLLLGVGLTLSGLRRTPWGTSGGDRSGDDDEVE